MIFCCHLLLALASTGALQPASSVQSVAPSAISRPHADPLVHVWLDLEESTLEEDQEVEKRRTDSRHPPVDCALIPVGSRVLFARALKAVWVAPLIQTLQGAISIGLARGPPSLA